MRSLTIYKAENGFIVCENEDTQSAIFMHKNPIIFEKIIHSYDKNLSDFLQDWGDKKDNPTIIESAK